jgi:hypothetical protein
MQAITRLYSNRRYNMQHFLKLYIKITIKVDHNLHVQKHQQMSICYNMLLYNKIN